MFDRARHTLVRLSFTARMERPHPSNESFRARSLSLSWKGTQVGLRAAVERAHYDRAHSVSKKIGRVAAFLSSQSLASFSRAAWFSSIARVARAGG
jgi:hypothetical protein